VRSDAYRIAVNDLGVVSCVRTQVRELAAIAVHGSEAFECGPGAGVGADDLALTILADFLGASVAVRAYAMPLGTEGAVWDLHRRFRARWLSPRQLGAGEFFELSAAELEEWLAAERAALPNWE
jgi:hypothetical protein